MSTPTTSTASAMRLFAVILDGLVTTSTINGFSRARARSWKDFLFDRRTTTEKLIDEILKDGPNVGQYEKAELLTEQILAAIKAEVAAEVQVQLAGRDRPEEVGRAS